MIFPEGRLRFTVALLVVALAGLMVVQGVLLRHAWQLKTQAFDRNVRSALALTVQQLDASDIAVGASALILEGVFPDTTTTRIETEFLSRGQHPFRADTLKLRTDFNQWVTVRDTEVEVHDFDSHPHAEGTRAWVIADSLHFTQADHWMQVSVQGDRQKVIQRVVSDMFHLRRPDIHERLAAVSLDSVLDFQLRAAGLDVEPDVAVLSAVDDSPVHLPDHAPVDVADSPYRARLFSLDLAPPHFDLVLAFPGEQAWLLRQTAPLFIASVVFSAIVIAGFFRTVRTLLEQRRFASQVVGFVNNMTHEFQTPLSTLTLAAEAMERGAGPGAAPHGRYTRMIREETARMGRQVERILQVASLERGDLELVRAPVDGRDLLEAETRAFGLRVESLGGTLRVEQPADEVPILADEVHLEAALDNLLENAVKYSTEPPDIRVEGAVAGGRFVIRVADRGMGVDRRDRERVFEPYYRCPTGDRHDVKGYGLGLSYVRLVARAHGGEARLEARPGGGTVAVLTIPTAGRGEA